MPSPTKTDKVTVKATAVAKQMTFGEAVHAVAQGAEARRMEWPNASVVILMSGETLSIRNEDNVVRPLIVTIGDIANADWLLAYTN